MFDLSSNFDGIFFAGATDTFWTCFTPMLGSLIGVQVNALDNIAANALIPVLNLHGIHFRFFFRRNQALVGMPPPIRRGMILRVGRARCTEEVDRLRPRMVLLFGLEMAQALFLRRKFHRPYEGYPIFIRDGETTVPNPNYPDEFEIVSLQSQLLEFHSFYLDELAHIGEN